MNWNILWLLLWACHAHAVDIQSVGTFGGFVENGKIEIPQNNGFLAFAADNNLREHRLQWKRFDDEGADLTIASIKFPDTTTPGKLKFKDWSTLEVDAGLTRAYLSRTFPAVRYLSSSRQFILETRSAYNSSRLKFAFVINGKISQFDLAPGQVVDMRAMSEPWIVLWNGEYSRRNFDIPIYLTLDRRAQSATLTAEGLKFEYSATVGTVNVMPLRGVMRFNQRETLDWLHQLPLEIIYEVRAWVQKIAAYPIAMKEHYKLNHNDKTVEIENRYQYQISSDVWGTQATPIAPVPPVVVRAGQHGYPVILNRSKVHISKFATFYGNYAYELGETSHFKIPIPNAIERLPIALKIENSPQVVPARQLLEELIRERMPQGPSGFYVHNDDIASALMCDAFSTFESKGELQQKIAALVPRLFAGSLAEDRAPWSTEPVTGQKYRSAGKHQYENAPFDREWYTGRKLAAIARCSEALDINLAKNNWQKIKEMYRYSQIFFDWVTGSVTSSVYGWNQLADGIHFNWEGVLGVARMAKLVGDQQTYADAVYRSARQQLALYTIWYQAQWSKEIDYAIAHFSVKRLPQELIETRGAVDAWVEDFGSATLEFKSMWQTSNYIFMDNPAQYSLYRDFGMLEKIRRLSYEIMPAMHPHWRDGNVLETIDKKHYGSGDTLAHMQARAVLFHDDPTELFAIFQGFQGTEVTKHWYTPNFYGIAGPLMLAIERAQAPVVEAPIAGIKIEQARFDMATGQLKLDYTCRTSGEFDLVLTSLDKTKQIYKLKCQQEQQAQFNSMHE